MKEGSERHGDKFHYLYPAIEESLVKQGADAGKVKKFLGEFAEYHKGIARGIKAGVTGKNAAGEAVSRAEALKPAAKKLIPHASILAAGLVGKKLLKKEDKAE